MWLRLSCLVLLGACTFDTSGLALPHDDGGNNADAASGQDAGDAPDATENQDWWNDAWQARRPLIVSTGANTPANGYQGYTVRLAGLDTAAMISANALQGDCDDLRVVRHEPGGGFTEIDRHVIDCNSGATEVRFMLAADMAANSQDIGYFLYHDNAAANAAAALDTSNVYLWWDDASSDRLSEYVSGRLDTWGSTNGWVESQPWDAEGYYAYTLGDDLVSNFRRPVNERDVYIEAEFFHTDCYPSNMVSGLVVRGIIAMGTGGDEEADHYYTSIRGHHASCGNGYEWDGDIHKTVRSTVVVDGPDPAAVPVNQWRRQGLAAWGVNPTNLTFWDADTPWPALGWPEPGHVQASGTDADDYEGAGFAGVWMAQDSGRFRNMLIRRYVDPEPTVTAEAEQPRP